MHRKVWGRPVTVASQWRCRALKDIEPVTIGFRLRNWDDSTTGCGLISFVWLVNQCFKMFVSGPEMLSEQFRTSRVALLSETWGKAV